MITTETRDSHTASSAVLAAGDDERWQAVLEHDGQRDREFVYAVRSTGVYCRPSCPARRPRRSQVLFFEAAAMAERAGFRPCRRCTPEPGHHHGAAQGLARQVAELCRLMDSNAETPPKLAELAAQAGTSPHALSRAFRKIVGITPRQYADAARLRRLKSRLQSGADVTTALYDAGYGSSSRLYESAHATLGMTPNTYRLGGKGMQIAYTIEPSKLGRVLVAATSRGISAVYLGDRDAPLERALHKEYPRAEIRRNANGLGTWVRSILRSLENGSAQQSLRPVDLPLDVEATAFQRRVWEELRKIPYGTTRSYSQVARAIGRPAAVRAVARACATNPVSLVVPCHRVVREDGRLAGYRWGLRRKSALIEQERTPQRAANKGLHARN